jgi:NADH-quinone oxidoreductase subunit J
MIAVSLGFKWFIFIVMALLAIGSSLMMVTRRNPIHSALWLVVTFFSIATHYVLLNATFIAVAQVMVYAGAIMMLTLFIIMLIHLEWGRRCR